MIAEAAAYAKAHGTNLVGLMDRIFCEFGFIGRWRFLTIEVPRSGELKGSKLPMRLILHLKLTPQGNLHTKLRHGD